LLETSIVLSLSFWSWEAPRLVPSRILSNTTCTQSHLDQPPHPIPIPFFHGSLISSSTHPHISLSSARLQQRRLGFEERMDIHCRLLTFVCFFLRSTSPCRGVAAMYSPDPKFKYDLNRSIAIGPLSSLPSPSNPPTQRKTPTRQDPETRMKYRHVETGSLPRTLTERCACRGNNDIVTRDGTWRSRRWQSFLRVRGWR